MYRIKQIFSILLCFIMLIAFSTFSVSAVTTIEYGDFTLAVNGDNTYSLYKYNGSSMYVSVPDEVDGFPVVAISGNCFENCGSKYIILTNNITTIRDNAFYGAENLASISIPSSVKSIGKYAFSNCTSLSTVSFADNNFIDIIPVGLFIGCTNLKNINIPDKVTSIGESAFSGCIALTSLELPKKLNTIKDYAFNGCTALENISIPEGVASIGNYCFYECSALSNAEVPLSCTSIGTMAFYNCSSLRSVFIPRNVTTIGADCFAPMSYKQKIVANGFTGTYAQEYSYANGVNFAALDVNIGDANFDNEIDINDVTLIQKHLAKISVIDTSLKRAFADTSLDGVISIRDATRIQMYIAKYIYEF